MTVLDDFDSLTVEDNLIGYKGNLYQVEFRSIYSESGEYNCATKTYTARIYDIFGKYKESYFQIFSTDMEDGYKNIISTDMEDGYKNIMNSALKTIVNLNIVSSDFYK